MRHTARHYALALDDLTHSLAHSAVATVLDRFIAVLTRDRAGALLPRIIETYLDLAAAREGKTRVTVQAARPLTADDRRAIATAVDKDSNDIIWDEREDPTLLAGARIRHGDTLMRCSLTDRLECLRESL